MLLTTKNVQTSCPSVALLPLSMCTIRHHWNGSTHTDKTKHSGSSRNNVQLFHLSVPQADKQPSLAGYPLVDTLQNYQPTHKNCTHQLKKYIYHFVNSCLSFPSQQPKTVCAELAQHSTIRFYLSGVWHLHIIHGYKNPLHMSALSLQRHQTKIKSPLRLHNCNL